MIKYGKYIPSGVNWVESIPAHWTINQIKRNLILLTDYDANGSFSDIAKNVNRVEDAELKYAWFVRTTDLEKFNSKSDIQNKFIWVDIKTYNYLKKSKLFGGELLLAKRGDIGRIYLMPKTEYPASLAPNLYLARLDENVITSKFAFYFLKSSFGLYQLNLRNKSTTIGALYKDDFKSLEFVFPTISEQKAIAQYLDTKTQAIDKKVSLLEKKIDYYTKLRKSLINDAVTKGLDKNVELKDSGIDWIGQIPKHWGVTRVKDLFKISRGRVIAKTELLDDGKFPVYSSQTENKGILGYINTYDFDTDLITWTTDGVNAGTVFRREGKFSCTNICGTLIPKNSNKTSLDYFGYAIAESTQHNKRIDTNGAKIMSNEMAVIHIIEPPTKEEQTEIAQYLDDKTSTIDAIVTNIGKQIDQLKELRKTLINDVVTGKIKVVE